MNGIYQSLYDLLSNVLFGGVVVGYQELVLVFISTTVCLASVALPFIIVWKVCKMVMGG